MAEENSGFQTLTMRPMVRISQTLEGLVQGILGPCGQQMFLSTHTGKVLVTRDGLTVLSSLHVFHPIAECVIQSLRNYHSIYHDGSKTFILYLAQILKTLDHYLELEGIKNHYKQGRIKLSAALDQFLHTDFEEIIKLFWEIHSSCTANCTNGNEFESVAKNVLKASLCTCLQKHIVVFFVNYLSDFLCLDRQTPSDCLNCLIHVLQNFSFYHTKITNQLHQQSKICQGVLVEANLEPYMQAPACITAGKTKNFILIEVDFDEFEVQKEGQGNPVLIRTTSERVPDFLAYKRVFLKKVISNLKEAGVSIILCSETVPLYFAGMCREEGMAVVCLQQERILFLQNLTGVPALKELFQKELEGYVFTADITNFVHIGNKVGTLIQLHKKCCTVKLPVHHMVICAPTEGQCDQLCQSLYKTLKALFLCFEPWNGVSRTTLNYLSPNPVAYAFKDQAFLHGFPVPSFKNSLLLISSGGTFEAMLVSAITGYYSSQYHKPKENIDVLIKDMLRTVPETLHANLSTSKFKEQRQFTDKWTSMLAMACHAKPVRLDLQGRICDELECSHLEPVVSKLSMVAYVLRLVTQLLRVEGVVSVKRNFAKNDLTNNEVSDNEEQEFKQ